MSFSVGNTVKLKSGGPDMTVTRIGTAGGVPMVWCAWFEGTKDTYGLFPPEALKATSESSGTAEIPPEPPGQQLKVVPESVPTDMDSTSEISETEEAKQDPDSTRADSAPVAEKKDTSVEFQIASIQSLINDWLKVKRP
jgi:uncharacterized protein YodC (DUF2158 family)